MIKRSEIILFVVLALVFGIISLLCSFGKPEGKSVIVSVDGTVTGTHSLDEEQTLTLKGYDGGTNELLIRDHKASIISADCPDKTCVHQLAISHDGETIVCVPHRIVITVTGDKESEVDSIAR